MTKLKSSKLQAVIIMLYSGLLLLGCQDKTVLKLETFKTEKGWGYHIKKNEQIIIYQPTIPAVAGNYDFVSQEDAGKTGRLMLEKLKEGKPPAIYPAELDSMRVSYPRIVAPNQPL
ncbi:DUF4907 domain-containing protein [Sunxiuqinia sp. sy24]|uniref:DUF4907 domain-containing protein n=1 Tax=Sunxiuqinia sp. sy24 TaxID=3461495 RepID=UPI0040455E0F